MQHKLNDSDGAGYFVFELLLSDYSYTPPLV